MEKINVITYRRNWQREFFKRYKPYVQRKPWAVLRQLLKFAKAKGLKVSFDPDIDIIESGIHLPSKQIFIGKYSKHKLGKGLSIKSKDIRAIVSILSHEIGHYLTFEKGFIVRNNPFGTTKAKLKEELKASGHGLQLLKGFTNYRYSKLCLRRAYATYRRDYNRTHGITDVQQWA